MDNSSLHIVTIIVNITYFCAKVYPPISGSHKNIHFTNCCNIEL